MLIQYVLIAGFVAALALTWRRERQGAVTRVEALLWSALWVVAGTVVARPEVSSLAARVIGVGRGADLIVYVSVALLFFLAFKALVRVERMERDITALTRKLALREGGERPRGAADDTEAPKV